MHIVQLDIRFGIFRLAAASHITSQARWWVFTYQFTIRQAGYYSLNPPLESIMLTISQPAPDFSVLNESDTPVNLRDFRDKQNVVLYFYPKDDTPGCTIEANQFTALADEFARTDTVVIGVSKDSCESHRQFIGKYGLRVMLLSDNDGRLARDYGVWQEKEKDGVKQMGIVRSTFIIDKTGRLVDVAYGVNPDGHAREVLEKVRKL